MKRLTEEDINEINSNKFIDSWDQGIFKESSYVPTSVKGLCCVLRWKSEERGGSCWDDEDTVNEIEYYDRPNFLALDLALEKIGVNRDQEIYIRNTFIVEVDDAGGYYGYYGDYDNYKAEWVELEEIYKYLGI